MTTFLIAWNCDMGSFMNLILNSSSLFSNKLIQCENSVMCVIIEESL